MLKLTPLHQQHLRSNATMVDFSGWDMPLHYGSQIKEHQQVRKHAGMFDVSHMAVIDLRGKDVQPYLSMLIANDVNKIKDSTKALYTCMLNEKGGVIDDMMVYRLNDDLYRIVSNAGCREKDLDWMRAQINHKNISINERTDLGILAIQGPEAIDKVLSIVNQDKKSYINQLNLFESKYIDDSLIARTGYTGEDGLEMILPAQDLITLWDQLLNVEVTPCGLGARDTLRLEAGLMLYGQDLDETHTPLESGLGWTVALQPEQRHFIGREALIEQKKSGIPSKMVGLFLSEKGMIRTGQKVFIEEQAQGIVTSGSFSPTLNHSIGLARIASQANDECMVEIRGKRVPVKMVKPRFVKQGKVITELLGVSSIR
jgi:glycine cleavage system T protein (aminomethyltransferase)